MNERQSTGGGERRSRRRVLPALGVAAVGGIAGCAQFGEQTETPTSTPSVTPSETPTETPGPSLPVSIQERARTLVSHLAAAEYGAAAELFAADVGVTADALESAWASAARQLGALVGIEGTETTTVSGFDAVVVTARFSQGRQGVRVVFDEDGDAVGLQFVPVGQSEEWSPPAYVDTDAIVTTAVTVDSDACPLPGSVTAPATAAGTDSSGVPSFVLLGGSGPTGMDGTLGPNKPYRDIAWGAASVGGASSLRYTKRTAACQVDPVSLTIDDEYTADAVAAVRTLRAADGADPDRTAIVGHSLGAALAPRVAARMDGIAGVVLLAPPGRPLQEAIVAQTRYLAELDGEVTDTEQERLDALTAAADRVAALDIPDGETVLGGGRPYWRSLQEYDAIETARQLDVPVLVLFGGRDYQVIDEDEAVWRDGLSGESDATVRTYESLNHLFMPGEGQSRPAEYATLDYVDEAVIRDIGEWLAARWNE